MIKRLIAKALDTPNLYDLDAALQGAGLSPDIAAQIVNCANKKYCPLAVKKGLARIFIRDTATQEDRLLIAELTPWMIKNSKDMQFRSDSSMSSAQFLDHISL